MGRRDGQSSRRGRRRRSNMKRPKVGPPCSPAWESQPDGAPVAVQEEAAAGAVEEPGAGWLECPLCLLAQPPEALPPLSCCAHRSCLACLQQYWCLELRESRVPLACPHCPAPLPPAEVQRLLPDAGLRDKYEECLLRRLLLADPGTRWCPAPDCSYAVIAYGCAECPRLVCGRQDCRTEFCYHCRQPWHPNSSCEQAWQEWSRQAPGAVGLSTQLIQKEEATSHNNDVIKVCPRCGAFIMKVNDGSCNRMNCTVCGCLFCWLCLREITDVHFLSPSGCTFWGKKPWSRTRKILWQLGMVLGAPMVISLVAGVAVPVITLGIPIYMGKKVLSHGRKSKLSGCQQCLSVASSILLSLFVSPVITAVTVGVGVPLMLTYVYGVVVLSLCRNRWGCRGTRRKAGDHTTVELENLTKLTELLAVLPTPTVAEGGGSAAAAASSLPSSSHSQQEEPPPKGSQSASTMTLAGTLLREAQEASFRDVLNFEVEVEIEAEPQAVHGHSLCSEASGHSFSTDSLACTSDSCSLAGVTIN
ncbi:E3 ubiquitin-protein ligase RNF19B-like isoform X2 [Tiliqua scincoides]|uniref:E3 ubiquitin-protein ligase RNF19B-like isoform X2 n=1 Tax=Tiliqua scincoides TaxID=71010 RepID=UPI00346260D7